MHDSNCFTDLLSGKESAVYADSAYPSKTHSNRLEKRGIDNRLIKRAYRNRLNRGTKSTVERVFGL